MVNPRDPFLLATAIAFLACALLSGEVEVGSLSGENELGWAASWSACDGTTGECLGGEEAEEMAMDSESNRRILQGTGNYISYRGLHRDPSCPIHGVSYYQCSRPAPLNDPYKRPCTFRNECARGSPPF
ncbi:protein RALF-like 33 [Nymphaea colorata]|nr:protein RALF-like 33 [Nymphaea colorata]